jgi:membrane protein DedA with SNARE-associated domain
VGSALWNTALVVAGYLLGRQWTSIGRYSDWLNIAIIVALVAAVAKFVWDRRGRSALFQD